MRRLALHCLCILIASSCAVCGTWKLVLKDGNTIECDGAPLVINGEYLYRGADGKDGSLAADQIDREKTESANHVAPAPRQWRLIGQTVREAPGGVLTLSDADFETAVLGSEKPVLVDFLAVWCGYCKKMEPSIASIASEYDGKIRVGKLDAEKNPATARRYGIRGYPTLLLFKQGRVVASIHGYAEKAELVRMVRAGL
ncbi:MAG TPA: thioredoxin domain-containing protein [Bryobacteraceae bacterium]|nr:thioredoxin domain-containing protein [Bryobacteraceae bacterium]